MSGKRISVIGHPNLTIWISGTKTNYYWRERIGSSRYEKSTRIKAEFEVETVDGREMARPTKNVQMALMVAEKFKHEIIKEGCLKKDVLFSTLFDEVLTIQKNKSHRTYVIAEQSVKHLRPFLKSTTLSKFDDDASTIWAKYVQDQKQKFKRRLLHDCKFLVFSLRIAYQKRWVSRIYSRKDFPIPDQSRRVGQFIPQEDVARLINEIKIIGDKKFLCHCIMALEMGLRKSEILGLRLDEIDIPNREINLDPARVKTRKARQAPIPITNQVWSHLAPFINKAQDASGKHVFPSEINNGHKGEKVYNWNKPQVEFPRFWDKLRKKLGIRIRFHDFRHTCVTNLILQKIPLSIISQFLGADMKILNEVYAHHNEQSKQLFREALKGLYRF